MLLIEPRSYEETQDIADHLKNRKAVVINLQRIDREQALRVVDFFKWNGLCYWWRHSKTRT